jgi:hypothetical protein
LNSAHDVLTALFLKVPHQSGGSDAGRYGYIPLKAAPLLHCRRMKSALHDPIPVKPALKVQNGTSIPICLE